MSSDDGRKKLSVKVSNGIKDTFLLVWLSRAYIKTKKLKASVVLSFSYKISIDCWMDRLMYERKWVFRWHSCQMEFNKMNFCICFECGKKNLLCFSSKQYRLSKFVKATKPLFPLNSSELFFLFVCRSQKSNGTWNKNSTWLTCRCCCYSVGWICCQIHLIMKNMWAHFQESRWVFLVRRQSGKNHWFTRNNEENARAKIGSNWRHPHCWVI